MQFTGTLSDVSIDYNTSKPKITFLINERYALEQIDEIKNLEKLAVEAKKWRKKRSLDANAYCWVLIGKLADKLELTTTEVYRKAIKEVGVYEVFPVKNEAVERYIEVWKGNGLGWLCDTMKSKIEGYTNVVAWYGSSVYDSKEMSRLVDNVVEECKELGIETLPPEKIQSMKEAWGK